MRVSRLAEDLRQGRVNEKERFKYFLATFLAGSIIVQLFIYSGILFSIDSLISAAVNVTVAAIGIILCYKINKSGDNTDFIGRTICLGWPIGVQLVGGVSVFFLVFSLPGFLSDVAPGTPLSFLSTALLHVWEQWTSAPAILFIVSYYLAICWCIAYVAQAKESQKVFEMATTELPDGEAALAFCGLIGIPITAMLAYSLASRLVGSGILAQLITCLIVGLWMLLLGSIFVWLRRRSIKRV